MRLLSENEDELGVGEIVKDGAKLNGLLTVDGRPYGCLFFSYDESKQDKEYAAAIQAWNKFKAKQPKACMPANDSQQRIQAQRPKVTVVFFQGYAVSPGFMGSFYQMFNREGVNVLAPRLRGHFNNNPRDLDRVTAEEWLQQTDEVLKIASKMSPKVIVAGYSLGGLLASRLAVLHPDKVHGLLAFSPSWRVRSRARDFSHGISRRRLGILGGKLRVSFVQYAIVRGQYSR